VLLIDEGQKANRAMNEFEAFLLETVVDFGVDPGARKPIWRPRFRMWFHLERTPGEHVRRIVPRLYHYANIPTVDARGARIIMARIDGRLRRCRLQSARMVESVRKEELRKVPSSRRHWTGRRAGRSLNVRDLHAPPRRFTRTLMCL